MGGKTKQAQRTKNNVRPSSSGRSAELLSGSGAALPTLFPALSAVPMFELPPDFALAIKKLNKKDPITKTKALQELNELVQNSKVEDVVSVLPSWVHFYKTLSVDPDRKVREVTQICHGSIVSKCGRRVAPQLKALLPAWLAAQHDDHAPAQARAQLSLNSTFPDNKLPEAISFCKTEIMSHIVDNLLNAEAAVSKKLESAEERSAAVSRVLSGALGGLQFAAQHLPGPGWLRDQLQPLLRANAFWKLASHADHQVRSAWYLCIGALWSVCGEWLGPLCGTRALRLLLGAREATAAAPLWAALLQLVHHDPEWYERLEKKELLSTRIVELAASGGGGAARLLADTLLPLLAHLPPELRGADFYAAFFPACFTGLEKISSSKSERQIWITSVAECVRYVSVQADEAAAAGAATAMRAWLGALRNTRDNNTRLALVRHSAHHLAALIKYWLKLASEDNTGKFDKLVRTAWQTVGATLQAQAGAGGATQLTGGASAQAGAGGATQLTGGASGQAGGAGVAGAGEEARRPAPAPAALLDAHCTLLHTLRIALTQEPKKVQSIRFDDEVPTAKEEPTKTEACDPVIVERYLHNLNETVHNVCAHYLEIAKESKSVEWVLNGLMPLLTEFDSKELWGALARSFGGDSPGALYSSLLRPWLVSKDTRDRVVLDVVFLMMKHLSEEEQDVIFNSFNELDESVVEWAVSLSSAHPARGSPPARRWLRGAPPAAALRRAARAAAAPPAAPPAAAPAAAPRSLLLAALHHADGEEPLVSEETISQVLEAICECLESASAPSDGAPAVAALLASTLATPRPPPHYTRLLTDLFNLTLSQKAGGQLCCESWREARSAWQDGLSALAADQQRLLTDTFVNTLLRHVQSDSEEIDISRIEHAASLCPYLVGPTADADSVCGALLAAPEADRALAEPYALAADCVRGALLCPFDDDNDAIKRVVNESTIPHLPPIPLPPLVRWGRQLLWRALVLRALGRGGAGGARGEHCLQLLYDYCILRSLHRSYAAWAHYSLLDALHTKLSCVVEGVVRQAGAGAGLLPPLAARAAAAGYYWAAAYAHARTVYAQGRDTQRQDSVDSGDEDAGDADSSVNNEAGDAKTESLTPEDDFFKMEETITGNGYFHSLQAACESGLRGDPAARLAAAHAAAARALLAALGDRAAPALAAPAADPSLDAVIDTYYNNQECMLYETDLSSAPWVLAVSVRAVCELSARGVRARAWALPAHHWDFINISISSLLASLDKSKQNWDCTKVAMVSVGVLRLYQVAEQFISGVKQECLQREPSEHVAALPREWADVFEPAHTATLLCTLLHVLETSGTSRELSIAGASVLSELTRCVRRVRWAPGALGAAAGALTVQRVASACARVMMQPAHPGYKYLAYYTLLMLAEPMVLEDAEKLRAWSATEGGEAGEGGPAPAAPAFALSYLHDALTQLQDVVDAATAHLKAGEETCEMMAGSDSHSLALGWFLLHDAVARTTKLQHSDLQQHYIELFRTHGYGRQLVACALRLVPAALARYAADPAAHAAPPLHVEHMFLQVKDFTVDEPSTANDVAALACRALFVGVSGPGAGAARGWWGAAGTRAARSLQRLVAAYVSPRLLRDQLQHVQDRRHELPDTEVTVHWSSYEVACVLTVEDKPLELRVWLARDHPLGAPRLQGPRQGGGAAAGGTHWLALYLAYQHGSVLQALRMWVAAVTARVSAAPQCYICYCRLHPHTARLPTIVCHQCHNKFHNDCLRKWFATSNKSNCPLCRATF